MNIYDRYNPMSHEGFLPVRTLQHNFIEWFEKVTPDFYEEIFHETEFSGLQKGITYNISREPISVSAEITASKKITLYENYNQFLWTVCYSLIVLFDEGIQIPTLTNRYSGTLNLDNIHLKRAVATFKEGFNLFKNFNDWVFFELPNPEKYNEYEQYYIEKANGVFTAAMTYTLLHEFGHQYYGHLDTYSTEEESKSDELTADDYAYEKVSSKFGTPYGETFKFGVVAAITSLYFFDETLKGGTHHPDPDFRLKVQLEKMNLEDLDNLWGFASLAFKLWTIAYNKQVTYPTSVEHYKELYELTANAIKDVKDSATE